MKTPHNIIFIFFICISQSLSNQQVQLPKGIHWDIEPQALDNWDTDQKDIIPQYLDLLENIAIIMKGTNLLYTVDIPPWFDSISVTRNGITKLLSEFVSKENYNW